MATLREPVDLGVGFSFLVEALDLTTPSGRAMAGILTFFTGFERELLREQVRSGIAQSRREGRLYTADRGRPH